MTNLARRHNSTRVFKNKHGFRGIEWRRDKAKFTARIEATPGARGRWLGYYDTAEEAARAYDDAARKEYGAEAFLNFPRPGERAVVASQLADGLCANGHDIAEHGYARPDGRGVICRACNTAAQRRRQAKLRSHPPDNLKKGAKWTPAS